LRSQKIAKNAFTGTLTVQVVMLAVEHKIKKLISKVDFQFLSWAMSTNKGSQMIQFFYFFMATQRILVRLDLY
jgi:hypothetical protein